jgi:hypothetical protein
VEKEGLMRALVVLVMMLVAAAPVVAQRRDKQPAAPAVDRREEIKKKIRVLRAATLQQELNLDEKALAKLLPVLSKWDDVTDKLLVQRVDLVQKLKTADQIKDSKQLDKLIDDAVANQKAFWDLEDKRLAELRKILTPAQTAKLLIVLPQFERKIQNQLRRAINRRNGGGDETDDDDDLEPDEPPRRR